MLVRWCFALMFCALCLAGILHFVSCWCSIVMFHGDVRPWCSVPASWVLCLGLDLLLAVGGSGLLGLHHVWQLGRSGQRVDAQLLKLTALCNTTGGRFSFKFMFHRSNCSQGIKDSGLAWENEIWLSGEQIFMLTCPMTSKYFTCLLFP
jgi:hypothetical protein